MATATSKAQSAEQPAPDDIAGILAAVSAEVGAIGKASKAPAALGGFSFRGVDAVVNAVHPVLTRYGVTVTPEVLDVERVTTQSKNGGTMLNVYVRTRFTFHGPAGDSLSATVLGEAADAGDKATSKAQSVALRVALLQVLMLPTDEPDPDAQGYERAGREDRASHGPARRQDDHTERSQEPEVRPAHLKGWDDAFNALTPDQQQWVRDHWPINQPPLRMTVQQAAQAVEWLAANVPPA